MGKICISIVVYNSAEDTLEAVLALKKINFPLQDVFIVDNNSRKEERELLKKNIPAQVNLIFSHKNPGYAGGHNQIIKRTMQKGYEYFFLLNPDVLIYQDNFFKLLVNTMEMSGAGIIGPIILYEDRKNIIQCAGGYVNTFVGYTQMFGKNKRLSSLKKKNIECDFVSGSAIMIKRNVFEKLGLLPENYFLYFEESDFCYTAKRSGIKVMICTQAHAYHKSAHTIGYLSKIYLYYMIRNYPLFAKKHLRPWYLPFFWVFYVIYWIPGYTILVLKNHEFKKLQYIFKGALGLSL